MRRCVTWNFSANPKFHLLLVRAVTGTARRREAAAEKTPTASFPPFLLLLTVGQRPKGLLRADAKGKGGTLTTATQVKVIRKEKHSWVPASPRQGGASYLPSYHHSPSLSFGTEGHEVRKCCKEPCSAFASPPRGVQDSWSGSAGLQKAVSLNAWLGKACCPTGLTPVAGRADSSALWAQQACVCTCSR